MSGATQGCFIVHCDSSSCALDIRVASTGPVSDDQTELHAVVVETETALRSLFDDRPAELKNVITELAGIASVGLVGPTAQPALAKGAVELLKNRVAAIEGVKYRTSYIVNLGIWAAIAGLVALLPLIVNLSLIAKIPHGFWYLMSGTSIGVWLSVAGSKRAASFGELVLLRQDTFDPVLRLIFANAIAVVFGLILSFEVVVIDIGNVKSSMFVNMEALAFLLGCFAGLGERALAIGITKRAQETLKT
jgi:hypothetical protein